MSSISSGLVQNHDVHFVQAQRAALQMVDDPARRAHHDLRAFGQSPELPFNELTGRTREES